MSPELEPWLRCYLLIMPVAFVVSILATEDVPYMENERAGKVLNGTLLWPLWLAIGATIAVLYVIVICYDFAMGAVAALIETILPSKGDKNLPPL